MSFVSVNSSVSVLLGADADVADNVIDDANVTDAVVNEPTVVPLTVFAVAFVDDLHLSCLHDVESISIFSLSSIKNGNTS